MSIPEEEVNKALTDFRNSKDLDIQTFLNRDAVEYENRRWCSTYVMVNEETFTSQQSLQIEGYFTLSNKVLYLQDGVSKTIRKKLANGLLKTDDHFHVILIGQLGKYINLESHMVSDISAKQLLDEAFEIVEEVKERITTRAVLLECRPYLDTNSKDEFEQRQKLHKIYTDYGFVFLQNSEGLTQYIKFI